MDQKIKAYSILLVVNIAFNSIAIAMALIFILSPSSNLAPGDAWLFILPLFFFLMDSLYIQLFIRHKFPAEHISNKIEGFTYLFGILVFLSAFFVLLPNFFMASNVIYDGPGKYRSFLTCITIPSTLMMISSIIIAIYSFRLLNTIRKNRHHLVQQLKELGSTGKPL